eukprot:391225-Alexandrium_andersonii.AAC.1
MVFPWCPLAAISRKLGSPGEAEAQKRHQSELAGKPRGRRLEVIILSGPSTPRRRACLSCFLEPV